MRVAPNEDATTVSVYLPEVSLRSDCGAAMLSPRLRGSHYGAENNKLDLIQTAMKAACHITPQVCG